MPLQQFRTRVGLAWFHGVNSATILLGNEWTELAFGDFMVIFPRSNLLAMITKLGPDVLGHPTHRSLPWGDLPHSLRGLDESFSFRLDSVQREQRTMRRFPHVIRAFQRGVGC